LRALLYVEVDVLGSIGHPFIAQAVPCRHEDIGQQSRREPELNNFFTWGWSGKYIALARVQFV
jgi:hypothetical protein